MIRIDSIVLALRQPCFIARLLKSQFTLAALGCHILFQLFKNSKSHLYSQRGDGFEEGFCDRCVHRV